jgi:AraC-like DNA-binding protein
MTMFRFAVNPREDDLRHCSAVLNGRVGTRDYHVDRYRTTLSVKSVVRGSAFYHTSEGQFLVDEDSFLILNHDQEYSLHIAAGTNTETLCPFFQHGLIEHIARSLRAPVDRELDEIAAEGDAADFCEHLYPKRGAVGDRLTELHAGMNSPELCGPWLEDHLIGLAEALVRFHTGVRREIHTFPGMRQATREEHYRRLHRARDYMDSCFPQDLSVASIARVAHLSPFHFQRMFKLAFGLTPMQYLQARRLHIAKRLLATSDRDVTSICIGVGFESLSTFSWLFRKRFGRSPRAYRRQSRWPRKSAR